MTYRKCVAVLAALASGISSSAEPASDTPSADACPGATAWELEHRKGGKSANAGGDRNPAISEAALLDDLRLRVQKDQAARKRWLADRGSEEFASAVESMDGENLAWLRKLISEKGFPTAAQVGNEGVHLAWVLVQHADQDPKLQSDLLPVLEQRFSAGELPANDLARITDRVLMASGKSQRYGTQFDWFAGDFTLPEPARLAEIDAAREQLGLMPLVDYVCTIRRARNSVKQMR